MATTSKMQPKEKKGPKRTYQSVSAMDRLKLVLLITEQKNTCFAAARKLDIPYTNAKVIYRTFRLEGRVIAKERFFRRGSAKRKVDYEGSSDSSTSNKNNTG